MTITCILSTRSWGTIEERNLSCHHRTRRRNACIANRNKMGYRRATELRKASSRKEIATQMLRHKAERSVTRPEARELGNLAAPALQLAQGCFRVREDDRSSWWFPLDVQNGFFDPIKFSGCS
ncbi:hypothetical protein HPB50_002122 [Hyalomma asiaticum]|uniref:Uncharacterized protein n=1 Tax=Hyalomma asiaticum TaxID=266040 RepID=A0ACB7TDG4_HYAAI|nr:hypothetical protein HPB50_002122 [Hyalomma asiaticum]